MIFVTVGTQKFQLDRLLHKIDKLAEAKSLDEEIFAQIGHSEYIPQHMQYSRFLTKEEYERHIAQCDLLITHSGVGTIISGVKKEKPVIVFPRLSKYGEHIDDHQIQIAESFCAQNYVLLAQEHDDLMSLIQKARTHKFARYISQREQAIRTIFDFLENMQE